MRVKALPNPPKYTLLLALISIPAAAFVVTFVLILVFVDDVTESEESGAVPPITLWNVTHPVPAVTVKLREVVSELMVDSNSISPEVSPLVTRRLAVSTTGVLTSIYPPKPCVPVPSLAPPIAFRSPLRLMIVPLVAPRMILPALPPLRFVVAPAKASPPLVVTAPILMLPPVLVTVTAAALLPTPRVLLAPVVTISCKRILLVAVSVTLPEAVPVSSPAVVVIFPPTFVTVGELAGFAVNVPLVAIKFTLPPFVRIGSFKKMEVPLTVIIPLA